MEKDQKPNLIGSVWKMSAENLKREPLIFLPFLISGSVKLLFLLFIFLAPMDPFSIFLGPPIRRLWGERFLHYPFNFLLTHQLFHPTQIIIYIILDGFLTGIAVWLIFQAFGNKKVIFKDGLKKAFSKYLTLTAIVLIIFFISELIFRGERYALAKFLLKTKIVQPLIKQGILDEVMLIINFLFVILAETLLAFAIPAAIIENKRLFRAIRRSFSILKTLFFQTFVLVLVPTILYLPVSLLKNNLPQLMEKTFPEITLVVLISGILIAMCIDCLVTSSVTVLFLVKKGIERESIP